MASQEGQFIGSLLDVAPGFRDEYVQHIEEYGELLPHVLMGDFTRWFIREVGLSGNATAAPGGRLEKVVPVLERAWLGGPQEVRDLVGASFLENLWQADERYGEVKDLLARTSPHLLAQLMRLE